MPGCPARVIFESRSGESNPGFDTILRAVGAPGVRFRAEAALDSDAAAQGTSTYRWNGSQFRAQIATIAQAPRVRPTYRTASIRKSRARQMFKLNRPCQRGSVSAEPRSQAAYPGQPGRNAERRSVRFLQTARALALPHDSGLRPPCPTALRPGGGADRHHHRCGDEPFCSRTDRFLYPSFCRHPRRATDALLLDSSRCRNARVQSRSMTPPTDRENLLRDRFPWFAAPILRRQPPVTISHLSSGS